MTTVDSDVLIEGTFIRLRRKRPEDAATDYGWRSDPELASFDAAGPLKTSFTDYVALYQEELLYPGPYRHMLAIETHDGRHIGNVMYYNIEERRGEAELGITIGEREYWGQGYGRDAVRTFLRFIFGTTNLKRIYLNTLEWNQRAQSAFEAGGFRRCGRRRRDGSVFVTMEALRPPNT